jgi:hypothetical protein
MNLSVGIVGLPNAGKSTLFNALLKKQQAFVASYPFATIEPNTGVVPVPDERLTKLADLVEKEEGTRPPIVPATVTFVDIAGLVKGASSGEGLGNKFLSHIREVSIILHVVRSFDAGDVTHVAGSVDPIRDKEIVETELALTDLQTLEKQPEPRGSADKETLIVWKLIEQLKSGLSEGKPAREIITNEEDRDRIKHLNLLTIKPVVYLVNVSENQISNPFPEHITKTFSPALSLSAKIESELASLSETESHEYLTSLNLSESGLNRVIKLAYKTLGLISFLTAGVKEVKAWTIVKGDVAPKAAGVIHTDFEKGFIKAEIVSYDDLIKEGSYKSAREHGKLRLEGKEYVMQDGDVVEFKFSV